MLHAAKLISADELPLNSLLFIFNFVTSVSIQAVHQIAFIDPEISVVICIMRASLGIAFGSQ